MTSIFKVKLKDKTFRPLTRKQQLSNVEILSFVGGLLGKFRFDCDSMLIIKNIF